MPVDLQPATPVALLCAVMATEEAIIQDATEALVERLGPLRGAGPVYAFDQSVYYRREMGEGLQKQLLCFANKVDPAFLPQVKGQTMMLERERGTDTGDGLKRSVNIDPGLLSIESLALATTKYKGHRLCIAPSLYGEVTLLYQKGAYRPFEWTYPDYRTPENLAFLQQMRDWLMATRD
jgi:hypothetical protein